MRYEHNTSTTALTTTAKVNATMTEINLQEFAEIILDRYTIFAFKCDCQGEHPECYLAREDVYNYAQQQTVRRIAEYISNYNPEH